uniref:Uncharacterized protein n=1 Tax=Rhizophora mucronata TaxID=61149 RepID=A0A2P2QWD0_RHIMU
MLVFLSSLNLFLELLIFNALQ